MERLRGCESDSETEGSHPRWPASSLCVSLFAFIFLWVVLYFVPQGILLFPVKNLGHFLTDLELPICSDVVKPPEVLWDGLLFGYVVAPLWFSPLVFPFVFLFFYVSSCFRLIRCMRHRHLFILLPGYSKQLPFESSSVSDVRFSGLMGKVEVVRLDSCLLRAFYWSLISPHVVSILTT